MFDEDDIDRGDSEYQETLDLQPLKINKLIKTTKKAMLIELDGGKMLWFPKDECELKGNTLLSPQWLINKEGL